MLRYGLQGDLMRGAAREQLGAELLCEQRLQHLISNSDIQAEWRSEKRAATNCYRTPARQHRSPTPPRLQPHAAPPSSQRRT